QAIEGSLEGNFPEDPVVRGGQRMNPRAADPDRTSATENREAPAPGYACRARQPDARGGSDHLRTGHAGDSWDIVEMIHMAMRHEYGVELPYPSHPLLDIPRTAGRPQTKGRAQQAHPGKVRIDQDRRASRFQEIAIGSQIGHPHAFRRERSAG